MKKIPLPLIVTLVVASVVLLGFIVMRSTGSSSGDAGNTEAITKELLKNNPKDAPELPPSTNEPVMPTRGKRTGK